MKYDENRFAINLPIKCVSTTLHYIRRGIAHTSTPFKTKIESIKKNSQLPNLSPVSTMYNISHVAMLALCLLAHITASVAYSVRRPYCRVRIKSTLITFQIGFRFDINLHLFTSHCHWFLSLALSHFGFTFQMEPKCWLVCHDDKYGIIHAIKPIYLSQYTESVCVRICMHVCMCVCVFRRVNSWWWWFRWCLLLVWRGAYRTHVEWGFFYFFFLLTI